MLHKTNGDTTNCEENAKKGVGVLLWRDMPCKL